MRPVFTDWASEVQRSIGFYTSANPDVKLARVVALGGGTKLRGLLKYLQQTLQIPVEKPDAFKRLAVSPGVSAAKFHESVADFGVVYGLALQGVGLARIESNLLPTTVARSMAWAGKTRYFIGAALMLLTVSLMCLGRVGLDRVSYARSEDTRVKTNRIVNKAKEITTKTGSIADQTGLFDERMKKQFEYFKNREIVPQLYELILSAMPNAKNNPKEAALYEAFNQGDIARVTQIPRPERKQLFLTTLSMYYSDDLMSAEFRQSATMRKDALMQEQLDGGAGAGYSDELMKQYEQAYGKDFRKLLGMGGESADKVPGFVVVMEGYSPYKKIGDLLDPPNPNLNDQSQWGLVTRLLNLAQFMGIEDANDVPFDLAALKKYAQDFKLETGPVDVDAESLPMGVGAWKFTPSAAALEAAKNNPYGGMMEMTQDGTWSLIDPVTKETISAEPELDAFGKPKLDYLGRPQKVYHDYWFKLQFKIKWTKAPPTPEGVSASTAR
jgi:hypothetical protein